MVDPHNLIHRGALVAEQAARIAGGNGDIRAEVDWWRQQIPALVSSASNHTDFGGGFAADRVAQLAETLMEIGFLLKAMPPGIEDDHPLLDIKHTIEGRAHACAVELSAWGARMILDVTPVETTLRRRRRRNAQRH